MRPERRPRRRRRHHQRRLVPHRRRRRFLGADRPDRLHDGLRRIAERQCSAARSEDGPQRRSAESASVRAAPVLAGRGRDVEADRAPAGSARSAGSSSGTGPAERRRRAAACGSSAGRRPRRPRWRQSVATSSRASGGRRTASTGTRRSSSRRTTRASSTSAAIALQIDDRGDTWTASVDLTQQIDRNDLPIMGVDGDKPMASKNDGVANYGNITTVAESPVLPGVLWVGTDDGNVQLSKDGGATWANVANNVKGVAGNYQVSRVEPSHFDAATCYVSFDNHRNDDSEALPLRHPRLRRDLDFDHEQPACGQRQRHPRGREEQEPALCRDRVRRLRFARTAARSGRSS